MLAALGWPVAEELNGPISKALGLQSTLISSPIAVVGGDSVAGEFLSRNPSILNGGLGAISPAYWFAVLAFGAATELYATKIQRRAGFRATMAALGAEELTGIDIDGDGQVGQPKMLATDSYLPGDLGFDPLGLYKGNDKHKADLQLKEVNNGRLAMIAITGYAFNEAATKFSVVTSMGLPKL
ncbi:chlorophyll a/b-binding-like protein [Baffinella frigidus]|nr:chlorophyll a/b-binding-like protein [Cryptophyta sp. CCMP2293]